MIERSTCADVSALCPWLLLDVVPSGGNLISEGAAGGATAAGREVGCAGRGGAVRPGV